MGRSAHDPEVQELVDKHMKATLEFVGEEVIYAVQDVEELEKEKLENMIASPYKRRGGMAKSSDEVLYDSKWYVQSKDRLKNIAVLSDCFLFNYSSIIDKRRRSSQYFSFGITPSPLFF